MSDLTDETIASLVAAGRGPFEQQMAEEIKRRRAEQAAGRDHVERVVVKAMEESPGAPVRTLAWSQAVARRVASRLSVPVLSEEDVAVLVGVRSSLHRSSDAVEIHRMLALLGRIIAAGKP